ncbi:MAG: hypothetical protein AABX30_00165 [Nanoarchaeota archaeon]
MRKIILITLLGALFLQFVSAEIILSQPKELYNLGEALSIQSTIKTTSDVAGYLQIFLICNEKEIEFYKEYIMLSSGQEKRFSPTLLLIKETTGISSGSCVIKATLDNDYVISNKFRISNLIKAEITTTKTEFNPGASIILQGNALRETGTAVEGIIEVSVSSLNKIYTESINKGAFALNISLPNEIAAGEYLFSIRLYEEDSTGNISNEGFNSYTIKILQVPKSLEILIENKSIPPGTNLRFKTILHDQTGVNIKTNSIVTLKNSNNKIIEQKEKQTDEVYEYSAAYNEKPSTWKIYAVSNKITAESEFIIQEKQSIDVILINKTLIIKNTGNVPYNKTILVKIGNNSLNIEPNIKVNGEGKYTLTAPEGNYEIEVITDGQTKLKKSVMLAGKVVDIQGASIGVIDIVRHPFVWFFIVGIFGFIGYMILRKGYYKTFIGKQIFKDSDIGNLKDNEGLMATKNKAELSLSIKGERQNISMVCLKIKNQKDLKERKKGIEDTMKKINELSISKKVFVYENQNYLFFIFAPVETKTFKNEKPAIDFAMQIQGLIENHNKFFKEKIEYGISINYGAIVAKKEEVLKFMSMGNLLGDAKKISSIAEKEILITSVLNDRVRSETKTEKTNKNGIEAFRILDVKKRNPNNEKFIDGFMRRLERDKKEENESI